jgi:Leu/Phe-tRNA-protein transferase
MFTRRELGGANASKLCLLALDRMLVECGFTLLDSQEKNDHMAQFGGEEVAFEEFEDRLSEALLLEPPALPVGSRT